MKSVKYYSSNDLMYGNNLGKCIALIDDYDTGLKEAKDINDFIELYNVKKYLDNKIYLVEWTPEIIERLQMSVNKYFGNIARFVKSIDSTSLLSIYSEVKFNYKNDFWELFDKLKVYVDITEESFQKFMDMSKVTLHELLKCKNITEYFGKIIREKMLTDTLSTQMLLDKYEIKHHREKDSIYFPKELSNLDKETIINNYIDSEDPNLNYLRLIANIQSSKDKLEISPKTILRSKRKAEEQEKVFFEGNSGIPMETSVGFSGAQDEEVIMSHKEHSLSITYSSKWIENNSDYVTLLNNFIYLFEFVDLHMRCTLVNKTSEMGVFERFLLTTSQNAYNMGFAFEQKNILSLLQMAGYYNQLFSNGIRLEEIIEWFFEEYLPNEFNAHNFKVTLPSTDSTYLEKCNSIMPGLESVLKQFVLFVEEGNIDFELLEIRSEHLIYKNIPSLVDKKFVYGVGQEFETVIYLLFSDQSSLGFYDKTEESYSNLYELLLEEELKINEVPDYNLSKIKWLIERNYLLIDEEENIVFYDGHLIVILHDLYMNDVIVYWKYSNHGRHIIEELKNRSLIEFESTLFSRPEQDYINYILNKSQFNNGLDLRNRYSHTQPRSGEEERLHNQNYFIFLRFFIIVLVKINDDFCTSVEIKKFV
ncbi:hypothetical protein [Paenibacillus sp. FJAT-26967]|uniref:hypothetical protein n=1 Tax=Paenibacillus sp. FJAT-26967 TaxID=1729690 RepID=UPI000AEF479E|nr:hypothetical protein [Paenibacillus sp. FJAT-26967]